MREKLANERDLKHEIVQFFIRKHWTHFVKILVFGLGIGFLITLFFLIFGSILAFFQIRVLFPFFAFLVIIVSILFINSFFVHIINYFFDCVIVTDCRIIVSQKTIFLKNDNNAIDLTKIQDIGVKSRGVLRNYLNYGAMIITLSTAMPPVVINCIPNPHYYLEKTNRVKRQHISKRQQRRSGQDDDSESDATDRYLQDIAKL